MMITNLIPNFLLAPAANACSTNLLGCLTPIYVAWFAVALIGSLFILFTLILIYGLVTFIGRSDIKTWTRTKILDVIVSFLLITIFGTVAAFVFTTNMGYLNSPGNLVPPNCVSHISNIYDLSTCEMYQFIGYTNSVNVKQYWLLLVTSSFQPGVEVSAQFSARTGISLSAGTEATFALIPGDTLFKYGGTAIDLIYGFALANDVQMIILAASALIFVILMSLGLIARVFGVTKTFGGAMIAFAVGVGVLYPLVTCITYGFINTGINNVQIPARDALITLLSSRLVVPSLAWYDLYVLVFGQGSSAILNTAGYIFTYVGLVWTGLTIVPIMNLIIVDVFIVDFSQAIGERIDLMSMLVRVL